MPKSIADKLKEHGVQPTAQRLGIAGFMLAGPRHATAEEVWHYARNRLPKVCRATVYNTLRCLVDHGLLRQVSLAEGQVVYDSNTAAHHHFVDVADGSIHDVPWARLQVVGLDQLEGCQVEDCCVVVRGRRQKPV
jgi:Fur family iron response transcriptional regulator